ncbi:MAG: hypothetical protein MK323_07570 [Gammaproteobacteria bacterium]|nr:hypothetical protein [Gammaproteobacteria bacterium]
MARRPGGEGTHRPRLSRVARRREPGNLCENLLEQRLRHRHLRHLESHVPGVPDHYGSDCPIAGQHLANGVGDGTQAVHPIALLRKAYGI